MGLKTILFGLAIWGIYLIVRHFIRERPNQTETKREIKSFESVKCAHCGLHLPQSEALKSHDHYYCCKAHIKADDENRKT